MIRYLKHNEIDMDKWNACILRSENGIIYAESWFLDIVCPKWEALVVDDYSSVMPLPVRKKFGIHYIFTPPFTQQLGVYKGNNIKYSEDEFLLHIPNKFKLIELKMNEGNSFITGIGHLITMPNYKININRNFIEITAEYTRNCTRNIRKFNEGISIRNLTSASEFAAFIKAHLETQVENIKTADFQLLRILTKECIARRKGEIIGLYNRENELLAAALFLFSGKRLIFTVCASSAKGKEMQAMYKLVNHQIEKYSQVFHEFDFSGSSIKGIAYFNSTFGAQATLYYLLKINKLPTFIRKITGKT